VDKQLKKRNLLTALGESKLISGILTLQFGHEVLPQQNGYGVHEI